MFCKELRYYFSTPIAYLIIGLFAVTMALFLWFIPGEWNIPDNRYADLSGMFQLAPWLLMLLCPALTMRLFAEEKTSGTWELLRSKGITARRIVLGKWGAAVCLTLIALCFCWLHYVLVYRLAEPVGNIDTGQFIGSWLGLCLLSVAFTSIGVLMASFSRSQLLSFIGGVVVCFVLYWTTIQAHFLSIARGVIYLSDVLYFVFIATVSLIIAIYDQDWTTK